MACKIRVTVTKLPLPPGIEAVRVFEKQMYMTIDEIKAKAQMFLASSKQNQPFVQTYNNGFEDGVNFVLQNLQQIPCTMQLELLQQMMKDEEQSACATPSFSKMEKHYANAEDIKNVMWMIRERQPIA